ncbi:probable bZIP transcription factor 11 at N-terminal half [Coccomyxa sp. Obi]|nr:probable bZIP transcription factor 11 at N-terminal half [Coccomyxa sp. Obi]
MDRDMAHVQGPLGRGGRPQRPATARHSLSGNMPAKGVAPRRGREGGLGGGSYSGGGEYEGEGSDDNRGHNLRGAAAESGLQLRPRRRTSSRYVDDEDEDFDSEFDGEGMTGGTSNGGGGDSAEKKRVGRPIAYKGDPNSPNLTEEERRRIKRRIANRESARRVRQKRQDVMEELQVKINALQAQNQRLMAHVGEVEAHKSMLTGQVTALRNKWTTASSDNMRLQAELGTLHKSLQMQQANLELLRGSAGAAAPGPLAPGTPTAAEMFGNIAAFYGLPNSGAGTASTPATTTAAAAPAAASAPAAAGPGIGGSGGGGVGISAFSNNGPSAFSPIQPLHSAGIAAATAFGAQRQPSDAWNVRYCPFSGTMHLISKGSEFLHAAARMGSGSLSLAGLGSLGSGQLAEGLGLAGTGIGSSSALNIAALNPAGSGRLPDLAPLNPAGSGRLSDLPPLPRAGSGRLPEGFSQLSSGTSGISRPTPLQASAALPPFSVQPNAAAAALADAMAARGSSTADHPEVAISGRAATPPATSGAADLLKQENAPEQRRGFDGQSGIQLPPSNRGSRPVVTTGAGPSTRPSMEEISALMFLKSSDAPSRAPEMSGRHKAS